MKSIGNIIKNNKGLFGYMGLSYIDKIIIFLLPLLILQLFKDEELYLSVEYVFSITIVIIPFLDFGLSGFFYYVYRNAKNKSKKVNAITKVFQINFFILALIGIGLILINYSIIQIDEFIIYIIARGLFLATLAFLSSYYRLINKPQNAIYISIIANFISLSGIIFFAIFDIPFCMWIIFLGQILFCILYFIHIIILFFRQWSVFFKPKKFLDTIRNSIVFSWPTILQVFVMMLVANFGKITALDNMPTDDGVLLSLTQRISMGVFLTHSSLLAFFVKNVYNDQNLLSINRIIFKKYILIMLVSTLFVLVCSGAYLLVNYEIEKLLRPSLITLSIISYTFMSCMIAYLEMHYGRENKNIIKLYLALLLGFIFITILISLNLDYLEKIIIAMFLSTFVALLTSITVLYKRGYRFN